MGVKITIFLRNSAGYRRPPRPRDGSFRLVHYMRRLSGCLPCGHSRRTAVWQGDNHSTPAARSPPAAVCCCPWRGDTRMPHPNIAVIPGGCCRSHSRLPGAGCHRQRSGTDYAMRFRRHLPQSRHAPTRSGAQPFSSSRKCSSTGSAARYAP